MNDPANIPRCCLLKSCIAGERERERRRERREEERKREREMEREREREREQEGERTFWIGTSPKHSRVLIPNDGSPQIGMAIRP